jgi:hypothetical protein
LPPDRSQTQTETKERITTVSKFTEGPGLTEAGIDVLKDSVLKEQRAAQHDKELRASFL